MENEQVDDFAARATRKRRTGFSDGPVADGSHADHDHDADPLGSSGGERASHYNAVPPPDYAIQEAKKRALELASAFDQPKRDTRREEPKPEFTPEGQPAARVSIPTYEAPDVDFIYMLRSESTTLQEIETETRCTIHLRGRGFQKVGSVIANDAFVIL
eukprot:TRINITY_DN1029_c0_g1_i3.p1 TRINITY_DN1029_c0_g1~~TRINITY_DN1029_c0_g1_i3.p1  ORF type:complete len:159 (-),score=40.17 TRINITY_DN1029_c0_g1_i3:63-539(-)